MSSPAYLSPFMTLLDDYKQTELNSPNIFGDSDRQSKTSLIDLKIETAVNFTNHIIKTPIIKKNHRKKVINNAKNIQHS